MDFIEEFLEVKNHFNLQTFQRRLRHLQSVAVRNLHCPRSLEVELSTITVYFTLHKDENEKAFYTSEKIIGSLNPTWQSFILPRCDSDIDLTNKFVVVRVWCGYGGKPKVKIEAHVYLSGLVFFANKLQMSGVKHKPDTLLFGMFNNIFIHYDASTTSPHFNQWIQDHEVPKSQLPAMVKVDHPIRISYTTHNLSRIHTIQKATKQTQVSVQRVHSNLEDRLLSSSENSEKLSVREVLSMKVRQLQKELLWQCQQKQTEQESLDKYRSQQESRITALREKRAQLQNLAKETEEKRTMHIQSREMLVKENAQVLFRRKQIISEMVHNIYPITEDDKHNFYICNVKLPNAEDYQGQDELRISVALGFTCHVTQMVSHFMDMPLRYPMVHRGSRSTIVDHIHSKLTEKDREFPLYGKGKEKFQYNYAVFLLNKNISQLRFYCGLGTNDLRQTLPNLKSLFEQRLGVRSTSAPEQREQPTSLQSPPATSLGGSQASASRRSQAASSNASSYNRKEFVPDLETPSQQPIIRSTSANFPLIEGIGLNNLDISSPSTGNNSPKLSHSISAPQTAVDTQDGILGLGNSNHYTQQHSAITFKHSIEENNCSHSTENQHFPGNLHLRDTVQRKSAIEEEDETEDLFKPSDDSFFRTKNMSSVAAFNQLFKDTQNDNDTLSSSFNKDLATNGIIPNSDIFHETSQRSFKLVKSSTPTYDAASCNIAESLPDMSPASPSHCCADLVSWTDSGIRPGHFDGTLKNDQDANSFGQSSSYDDSEMDASAEKNGFRSKVD